MCLWSYRQNFDNLCVNKSETYELNFTQNTHDLKIKCKNVLGKTCLGFSKIQNKVWVW